MTLSELVTALFVQDAREISERKAAAQRPEQPAAPVGNLEIVLAKMGLEQRAEQSRFYAALTKITRIEDEHQLPKTLFAEAGTGTGKTLAYLCAAHGFLKAHPADQAAIAVPSHALMDQVLSSWKSIQNATGDDIATGCLLGQGEFVSLEALDEVTLGMLEADVKADQETIAAIERWIEDDAPPVPGSLIHSRWTLASLRYAVPNFKHLDEVTLNERDTDNDPGYQAYQAQWDSIPQVSMLVMSHAMLASLTMRRLMAQSKANKTSEDVVVAKSEWAEHKKARLSGETAKAINLTDPREKRLYETLNEIYAAVEFMDGLDLLPNLELLIIDEAHTLEDAFSMVLTQEISIWSLRRHLKSLHDLHPRTVPNAVLEKMEALWNQFTTMARASDDSSLHLDEDGKASMLAIHEVLQSVTKVKDKDVRSNAAFRKIYQIARSIELCVKSEGRVASGIGVVIDWTPDRKWPRLRVGRTSVAREMDYLWQAVSSRTILVSGTLYEEMPQLSCEAARRSLNVPYEQMMTMEPVHAAWQYAPVTVCMVSLTHSPDGRARFIRPAQEEAEASKHENLYAAWVKDVSCYLANAHSVAEGGMLVLGTAYADIAAVGKALEERGIVTMIHRKGIALQTLRKAFLAVADRGGRPVLLAVAAAWTGFDLHSEKNPNALTDLAILNTPFGAISRTVARERRARAANGIFEVISQVVILVRQGIGRLVRSPDTPANRRIHWLDARVHQRHLAGILNPIVRVLAKYKQISV